MPVYNNKTDDGRNPLVAPKAGLDAGCEREGTLVQSPDYNSCRLPRRPASIRSQVVAAVNEVPRYRGSKPRVTGLGQAKWKAL